MKTSNEIGTKLIKLRGSRSLETVAADLQITPAALAAFEAGNQTPRDEVKIRICDYYGVSAEDLFFGHLDPEFVKLVKSLNVAQCKRVLWFIHCMKDNPDVVPPTTEEWKILRAKAYEI